MDGGCGMYFYEGKGREGRRKGNNGFLTEEEGEVKKSRKRIREKKEKPGN